MQSRISEGTITTTQHKSHLHIFVGTKRLGDGGSDEPSGTENENSSDKNELPADKRLACTSHHT
jgi:hypothetical protein